MRTKISVLLTIAGLVGSVLPAQAQLVVNQLNGTTITPTDLVNFLVAPNSGISGINNITFAGGNVQGGTYTGGLSAGLSEDSGVVLSSGDINTLPLPLGGTGGGASNSIGTPGNS